MHRLPDKCDETAISKKYPGRSSLTHDHLLCKAVSITQKRDGYRVGTDSVLLAASVSDKSGHVLDLGSGVGGVSFMYRSASS